MMSGQFTPLFSLLTNNKHTHTPSTAMANVIFPFVWLHLLHQNDDTDTNTNTDSHKLKLTLTIQTLAWRISNFFSLFSLGCNLKNSVCQVLFSAEDSMTKSKKSSKSRSLQNQMPNEWRVVWLSFVKTIVVENFLKLIYSQFLIIQIQFT